MIAGRLLILATLLLAGCAAPPVPPAEPPGPALAANPVVPRTTKRPSPVIAASARPAPAETTAEESVALAVDRDNCVFFTPAGVVVDEAGETLLQRHAERLKADPGLRVTLVGHTDDLGSRAYNLAIADQRVNAVYQLLRKFGAAPQQLQRYGAGVEKNGVRCRDDDCRRLMRRVEILYPEEH